ncbi:glucose-6-phosphate dehydrogenase [Bacillus sp. AGMB 02131]|uniref:Glucose-6-phosphate 1-dehydrogenase n=1 Tax=Peribacillus faecalis TaxID=2772559 RepID=A0A927D106_9BACI|nr:glucose-6-phosphate dehydrogenase [Peribacillus faecalis]MBD3109570.1 glucose-6-phosphate dehydrogenase [Peribacillus faecalis]
MNKKPASLLILFGATGDLANRKLYPSLYRLYKKGKIAEQFAVVGVARRELTDEQYQNNIKKSILSEINHVNECDLNPFVSHFKYHSHDVSDAASYAELKQLAEQMDETYDLGGNRLFYLAMAPEFFGTITQFLKSEGLTDTTGYKRVVIEKPFGRDYKSAEKLNAMIRTAFEEEEIYRIDHYLGKEMVQNIEVIRFSNAIFEPLWNNRYISNIQITSSETLGVEERGRYYDKSGALRDMVQNHMLQMVALLAMEPPISLTTEEIRSEKVRVLRALRKYSETEIPENFVRGQYDWDEKNLLAPYREEPMVQPDSNTETYVAGKIMIDNFRWAGVPFYIRTGKRMATKSTKIVVQFKDIPMNLYYQPKETLNPNLLVIHIQPDEGVTLHLNVKKSGQKEETKPIHLHFSNRNINGMNTPEAYERLIYDSMRGDATNFTHWEEVALSWKYVDRISQVWENTREQDFPNYFSGTMGPKKADELLEHDNHIWWPIEQFEIE